jgi:hypothetical protein
MKLQNQFALVEILIALDLIDIGMISLGKTHPTGPQLYAKFAMNM